MITYEDFTKLELRSGKILEAALHPDADKLLVLKVDLGDKQVQLVAGIKLYYQPETLVGRNAVILVNLAPKQLRGVESQGMLLAAHDETGIKMLTIDGEIKPGSVIK